MFEVVGDQIWFDKELVALIVPGYDGVRGAELKAALDLHDTDHECDCEDCDECDECIDPDQLYYALVKLMRAGSFSESQIEEFELIYESSI
jgi:hypothetical protein